MMHDHNMSNNMRLHHLLNKYPRYHSLFIDLISHSNMNINFRQLTLCAALTALFALPASSHSSINRLYADNISVARKDSTALGDSITKKKPTGKARKDSTAAKKENAYDKLVKKGGSVRNGLFTVRHIEDKWYFEVPQSITDRMLLAVTRFTSVPQAFKGAARRGGQPQYNLFRKARRQHTAAPCLCQDTGR